MATYAQTAPVQQILVADFNNDGIPDALVTSNAAPAAFLALGTTTLGTFAPASYLTYFGDCGPGSVVSTVIGDFNGDTYPDIAFNCLTNAQPPNRIAVAGVLLGNGDGTFGAAQTFFGGYGSVLLAGDFNHDGKLDLAAVGLTNDTDNTTGIMLFPGNGDGTFGSVVVSAFPTELNYPTAIAADINNDGFPDIVAGNFLGTGAYSVDVYGSNSDGTFGTLSGNNFTPNTSVPVGTYPTSTDTQILVGNFYDDGLNDIGVVDTGSGTSGVFLLQNTSTSGTYSLSGAKTPIPGIQSAVAGTFTVAEAQGASDLLVSIGGALSVLHNTVSAGAATFDSSYAGLTVNAGSQAYTAADANLDGYQDIYLIDSAGALSVNLVSGSATATSMPVIPAASEPITAVWAGNQDFTGSTATGSIVVEGLVNGTITTLVSALNPAPLGSPVLLTATVAPAAITSLVPTGTVTFLDGTATIGSSLIDTAGVATLTTSTLTTGAHSLSAAYSGDTDFTASTSTLLAETINVAPPDIVFSGPPSSPPGQQPTLTFTLVNPYPAPLSGTFTLTFASSATGRADDPSVQFSGGGRTLAFTIPALSTATPQVLLQSGTLSGTITITLALSTGGTDVTPANLAPVVITVPASAPVVSDVTAAAPAAGNTFTVIIDGLSNTLAVASAGFHFNAKAGRTISDPDITVQVPTPFAQWFAAPDSVQFGSLFSYTQQFTLSGGTDSISSVDVTLTNSAGTSTTVTGTVLTGTTP